MWIIDSYTVVATLGVYDLIIFTHSPVPPSTPPPPNVSQLTSVNWFHFSQCDVWLYRPSVDRYELLLNFAIVFLGDGCTCVFNSFVFILYMSCTSRLYSCQIELTLYPPLALSNDLDNTAVMISEFPYWSRCHNQCLFY